MLYSPVGNVLLCEHADHKLYTHTVAEIKTIIHAVCVRLVFQHDLVDKEAPQGKWWHFQR